MTTEDKNQQIIDALKSELDESVANINARDLSAIKQARHQALDKKSGQRSSWVLLPAGAIATACLALVVYSFVQVAPSRQNLIEENLELVSMLEILDLYEDPDIYEDLEFHEWLDEYESSS